MARQRGEEGDNVITGENVITFLVNKGVSGVRKGSEGIIVRNGEQW